MIDIHTHILPAVDDGVQTLQESIQLAIEYQKCGFKAVIATPHIKDGQFDLHRGQILEAVEALTVEYALAGVELDVYSGAEYYMDIRILKDFEKGEIVTLGQSSHVLLEFPGYHLPKYAQTIISLLLKNGFVPVLAHPERCHDINTRDARIVQWYADKGCLIQVDVQSLIGGNGRAAMKTSWEFFRSGLITVISMDAHRPVPMEKNMQSLEKLIQGTGKGNLKQFLDLESTFLRRDDLKLQK